MFGFLVDLVNCCKICSSSSTPQNLDGRVARSQPVAMMIRSIKLSVVAAALTLAQLSPSSAQVAYQKFNVKLTDSLGHFFAPLTIEGKSANFMFDSGCGAYFVTSKDFANSLDKELAAAEAAQLIDGEKEQFSTKLKSLAFGKVKTVYEVQSFVVDFGPDGNLTVDQKKVPIDGLVGSPFMKHFRVAFDYADSSVLFPPKDAKKGTLAYNKKQAGDFPVTLMEGPGSKPYVSITINGKKLLFLIDSGAAVNILTPDARKALKLRASGRSDGFPTVNVKKPMVGNVQLPSLPFMVREVKTSKIKADGYRYGGILGSRSLRQYKATLDFDSYQLIFDKSIAN